MQKSPLISHPLRFADRFANSIWRLLAKLWYPVLTRLTRHSTISFLNYGYSNSDATAGSLELKIEDEVDRVCIQLYDHLTGNIELRDLKVLEVSCGHGGGASYLARYRNPKSVHGIDRNSHAIRLCKKRHKVPGLSFACGNAMSLAFANDTFDAVVNVEASHCYPDLPHFLSEVRRVLRPGGYFIYADFRQSGPVHARVQEQLQASELEFISQENISHEVFRGMQLNNDRYLKLIERLVPRPLRKAARGFVGSEGSTIYQSLQSGRTIYFSYVLRKSKVTQSF